MMAAASSGAAPGADQRLTTPGVQVTRMGCRRSGRARGPEREGAYCAPCDVDPLERGDARRRCGAVDEYHLVLQGDGEVVRRGE